MKESSGGSVAVVYSPVTMKTVAVAKAGSRMTGVPSNMSPARLTRWALVLGCGLLSVAVLGAAEARPHDRSASLVDSHTTHNAKEDAGSELLHDVTAPEPAGEASLASFKLPAAGSDEKVVWMEVTAYCGCKKCCGSHAQGLTASGKPITYNDGHFVAADKKLFKFGAKLQIPGYADGAPVEVIDRGGAIRGYHIDVFFPTHEQARQWGRKWLAVTVVE